MTTFEVLNLLSKVRKVGEDRWVACCPAHDDATPSLSIKRGDDGRTLVTCFAGCTVAAVTLALAITTADLFEDNNGAGVGRRSSMAISATYPYRDENGALLFEVVRMEPKGFRQRRPDGRGGWIPNLDGVRRVLYRLPELLSASTDLVVLVVEGEKDADRLAQLGLLATTNPGGAGKWRPEYSEALRGRAVAIIGDNDNPGKQHATEVAASLKGVATSVRVLDLPQLSPKGDVSDYLDLGHTAADLLALVKASREAAVVALPVLSQQEDGQGWPDPRPLPEGLPSVPAFDDRLLPDALRPWLSDAVERTQCPPEYTAAAALVALGSVIGRGCGIFPKQHDDWLVVPNLWGALVGPPSSMKSPALLEALRPLHRLEIGAVGQQQGELARHAALVVEKEMTRKVIADEMKKAAKSGKGDMEALRASYMAAADPPEPTERRFMVNDASVEKLGELLNRNPRGLVNFRDELSGWLASLDRAGRENDRAFFLEAWNGRGRYTYDRIGRGTLHIEAACVSVLGGIQPSMLVKYLLAALRGGFGDDGLTQRFQLLVYPDPAGEWRNVDRWPDTAARDHAFAVFRRMSQLTPEMLAVASTSDREIPALRFDNDGQELFNAWRADLMRRLRTGGEPAAMEAHLAKYASLLPSLALICHLADADGPPGPVTLAATQKAAAWCDLLEEHARRSYAAVTDAPLVAARQILAQLRSGKLAAPFSAWNVHRPKWSGLTDREVVEEALELLEEYGWVRRVVVATGGRSRTDYHPHPCLAAKREAA